MFNITVQISTESLFCRGCYDKFISHVSKDIDIFQHPAVHKPLLLDIISEHPSDIVLDSTASAAADMEQAAYDATVHQLAQIFLSKRVIIMKELWDYYIGKAKKYGLLNCDEAEFRAVLKTISALLKSITVTFDKGLQVMRSNVGGACIGALLHWKGNSDSTALTNRIMEESIEKESLKEQIEILRKQLEKETCKGDSETDMLDSTVKILREKIKSDVKRFNDKIANNHFDLKTLNFGDVISGLASPEVWNLFALLGMNENSFKFVKKTFKWSQFLLLDNNEQAYKPFLKVFFAYAHCLYTFSSGTCNQPLHMMLSDILDKFSKSSSQCSNIFNSFGIVVSKDTLERFQVRIAQHHEENAPFDDINRYSFAYASVDNLDFLNRHARVRASVQGRGLNCTTFLAGQPKPSAVRSADDEGAATVTSNSNAVKKRPRARTLTNETVSYDAITAILADDRHKADKKYSDLEVTPEEQLVFQDISHDLFNYSVIKTCNQLQNRLNETLFPVLKAFLARKDFATVEKSAKSYIGIVDESCDNIVTIQSVLKTLYVKMGVGTDISHLVVVGDAKVYHLLIKLKDEDPEGLSWVLPFMGDWHTLKNYAFGLLKIYGPAGLDDLIALLHKGRTENCVKTCTDFEKTSSFFLQTWEALYRIELSMFFDYLENGYNDRAAAAFSKDVFMQNILDNMESWENLHETHDTYLTSLQSISEQLDGLHDEYTAFVIKFSEQNATFRFWHQYIHVDCMAYICLYLAGRSGNWHLRNHALKMMMPLFHVVNSTFYYRLLPRHLLDIYHFPAPILDIFKGGGFVMSLSGVPWSSLFLDETHEATINKSIKECVTTLSSLHIRAKTHYIPFRASMYQHFISLLSGTGTDDSNKKSAKDSVSYARSNEENVLAYFAKLKYSLFAKLEFVLDLKHIFSEETASKIISDSLLNFRNTGNNRAEEYVKCCVTGELSMREGKKRPYKFVGLKNFGESKKMNRNEKNIKNYYKSSTQFLSKIIQWCGSNNVPPSEIEQFISIPLTIATPAGLPIQKNKSDARKFLMKHFKTAFINSIHLLQPQTLIVDGMVVVYACKPLSNHNTFRDYAAYLFKKWVLDKFMFKGYKEIHFCFDRQELDIASPKSIERDRRDSTKTPGLVYLDIKEDSHTPYDWHNFLGNRSNKKKLVEFLSEQFVILASRLLDSAHILVISGGFKEPGTAQMFMHISDDASEEDSPLDPFCNNHLEGDTMLYLHAVNSFHSNSPVVLYSIDTDIMQIGLPMVSKYPDRHFIVHFKEGAAENMYVDLNMLLDDMCKNNDLRVFNKATIARELQVLYICSGCDYVSFFNNFSKTSFYDAYFNNIGFISSDGSYSGMLSQASTQTWQLGFKAFCRLLGCVFLKKCASSFEYKMKFKKKPTPHEIYDKIVEENSSMSEEHLLKEWLEQIRSAIMKTEGCQSEENWLPSDEALNFHWKRCCYVVQIWEQADVTLMLYPEITEWGWSYVDNELVFMWDSDSNVQRIERYRKLWTKGCKCKSTSRPCKSRACGCKKFDKPCGPACMCCTDSCQNKPSDPSIQGMMDAMYPEDENILDIVELMRPVEYLSDDESESESSDISDAE
jgi:hypothetical protein